MICPVCKNDRDPNQMSSHHLIPACCKGKQKILICSYCHHQIHSIFTEKELRDNFNSLESLLENEEMQEWIAWAKDRKLSGHLIFKKKKKR